MQRTRKLGLLGYPIDHSLSPRIHNCAYRELGLDWRYELYPCADKVVFAQFIEQVRSHPGDHLGFNVTTPYKVEACACADARMEAAILAGSANVLSFCPADGQVSTVAANTDGQGLVASLKTEGNCKLEGATVFLCGSGAVARPALLALADEGVSQVFVACRDTAKASADLQAMTLVAKNFAGADLRGKGQQDPVEGRQQEPAGSRLRDLCIEVIDLADVELVREHLVGAIALIDTTSLGMRPGDPSVVPASALHAGLVVLDVVYGHGVTALLQSARACGAVAIDGLGMLIEQAALTIEIWATTLGLSVVAPRELMRKAANAPHALHIKKNF